MTNLLPTNSGKFRKQLLLTIGILYLLILAGGIVRSTGSGMGCPDWPRCFGSWVPPTEASQLPSNYQELYGKKLKGEVVFNVYKTWTEYINRLLGALTGLFIFATLLFSIPFLRTDKIVFFACLLDFVLVGFQGWLGSRVVAAELAPWIVTVHMMLAILIVFVLLFVWIRTDFKDKYVGSLQKNANIILNVVLAFSIVQIIFGTQVREAMDDVIRRIGYVARSQWIENIGNSFYIHRSFSLLILALQLVLWYVLRKQSSATFIKKMSSVLLFAVILEIITGIVMAYFSVPALAQPIHLTLAIVLIGIQFIVWLSVHPQFVWKQQKI